MPKKNYVESIDKLKQLALSFNNNKRNYKARYLFVGKAHAFIINDKDAWYGWYEYDGKSFSSPTTKLDTGDRTPFYERVKKLGSFDVISL